jgi:menaquinone-dependent protoporphyrinogen oxidase
MENVLVVYASRSGSTADIARAIGDQLTQRGFTVDVRPVSEAPDAPHYDAVVLGSAVYMSRWDKAAVHFLEDQAPDLAERPTWLFQSGPCGPDAAQQPLHTPHHVAQLCSDIGAQSPTTFAGRLDRDRATTWLGRLLSSGKLAGDFRDWVAIRAWADDIADTLQRAPQADAVTSS